MNNKDLFFISIFTFITVIIWITTDAYHVMVASTIPPPLQRAIAPLTPKLDTSVIKNLKKRGEVVSQPVFTSVETSSASSEPTPTTATPLGVTTPTPTSIATASAVSITPETPTPTLSQ